MSDEETPELPNLLDRVQFVLERPLDFSKTDPETTEAKVRILTAAAHYFNTLAVIEFGGRAGVARDPGLVEQVIAAAFQMFGGIDPHPSPFDKAAMLLRGITQGHPFYDGNKRTGLLVATYYLTLMGHPVPEQLPVTEVVDLCIAVSAGALRDVSVLAQELQRLWGEKRTDAPGTWRR